jgi:hypothetical protein
MRKHEGNVEHDAARHISPPEHEHDQEKAIKAAVS